MALLLCHHGFAHDPTDGQRFYLHVGCLIWLVLKLGTLTRRPTLRFEALQHVIICFDPFDGHVRVQCPLNRACFFTCASSARAEL